ncbi:hypothetical protein RclHR1_09360004 [Rhizophagus clarus]|uniref:Uncharacterized protein n=1 Tax=Rhizophagus clarus TaxID=94130 RepID=A0A2Z6S4H1_9GLOM|nr:hypothetical protein RclHR1_09360004 [Rhizophagus clarus]GES82868.1 hypothetical protein GLOIN_2v1591507 [Rhizophagus clarus]
MYTEDLSSSLNSPNTSPTLLEQQINEKFNMQLSTPFNSSSTETKEQISSIIQRANELKFVVQKLIKSHAQSHLFNETAKESNINNKNNFLLNFNGNENQLLLLKQQLEQNDIISSQYDYDNIKDILDKTLFYNDICIMPPYFKEIYDTAYQDGLLNVGIDVEDFFILN